MLLLNTISLKAARLRQLRVREQDLLLLNTISLKTARLRQVRVRETMRGSERWPLQVKGVEAGLQGIDE